MKTLGWPACTKKAFSSASQSKHLATRHGLAALANALQKLQALFKLSVTCTAIEGLSHRHNLCKNPGRIFYKEFNMSIFRTAAFSVAALVAMAGTAHASFTVTYEAPGVTNSTTTFTYKGVENFNTRATGVNRNFTTDFGTGAAPVRITGQYKNVEIRNSDQYGGAGNTGRYPVAFGNTPYELTLSVVNTANSNAPLPATYFGYWLSALDLGNQVQFYRGSTLLFTYSPASILAATGNCPSGPYCGKPGGTNPNKTQPYVFMNFYDQSGLGFDRILFSENPDVGGYESDNHTIGYYKSISGTPIPEPASLALFGLGLIGLAVTRRRVK